MQWIIDECHQRHINIINEPIHWSTAKSQTTGTDQQKCQKQSQNNKTTLWKQKNARDNRGSKRLHITHTESFRCLGVWTGFAYLIQVIFWSSKASWNNLQILRHLDRGTTKLRVSILYPGSSAWKKSYCEPESFVFSQCASWLFRISLFLHVWCRILWSGELFHTIWFLQWAQGKPNYHKPAMVSQPQPPWKAIVSHQIEACPQSTNSHQNESQSLQKTELPQRDPS